MRLIQCQELNTPNLRPFSNLRPRPMGCPQAMNVILLENLKSVKNGAISIFSKREVSESISPPPQKKIKQVIKQHSATKTAIIQKHKWTYNIIIEQIYKSVEGFRNVLENYTVSYATKDMTKKLMDPRLDNTGYRFFSQFNLVGEFFHHKEV